MSEIATPDENSVVETPAYGELVYVIEYRNFNKTEICRTSMGYREDGMLVVSSFALMGKQKKSTTEYWRYPGEKEWRR